MLRQKFQAYVLSSRPLDMPYYFGNSLPVDLLNLQENEWNNESQVSSSDDVIDALNRPYSILSVGCGNLRNVMYTLSSLPKEFTGKLSITMNDLDPFVLARNVLFLYMMSVYSSTDGIELILTTLWYSLHLTKSDYNLLISCLHALIDIDGEQLKCPTFGVVWVSDEDLDILRQVWQGWSNLACDRADTASIHLKIQRERMFADDSISAEGIQVYKQQIPARFHKSVDDWIENGIFVPDGADRSTLTHDNPTLTGRKMGRSPWHIGEAMSGTCKSPSEYEFVYCVPTDLWPFGAWDFLEVNQTTSSQMSLIDMFHCYIANQVHTTIAHLPTQRLEIDVVSCDCLKLENWLKSTRVSSSKVFDRIFTSNVADYVGTATLLRAMKPLLDTSNKHSVIVTQYWNWYALFPESLVDHVTCIHDGTNAMCYESARKDTRQKFLPTNAPRFWVQEYYNNMKWFLLYLRSDLLACEASSATNGKRRNQAPSLQEVKNVHGLAMRDFRRELNSVAPFRYRRNIRPVNMLRGMSRMLEWYLPTS